MSESELTTRDGLAQSQELPRRQNIVVFGSRTLSEDMYTALQKEVAARGGNPEAVHDFFTRQRNVDYIRPAFYGVPDEQIPPAWAQPAIAAGAEEDGTTGDSANSELTARGNALDVPRTLPLGVLAFKQMRRYWTAGETVDTPFEEIEALCAEHDVPLVLVEDIDPQQFREQIGGMLALPAAALPSAPEA